MRHEHLPGSDTREAAHTAISAYVPDDTETAESECRAIQSGLGFSSLGSTYSRPFARTPRRGDRALAAQSAFACSWRVVFLLATL